MKFEIGKGSEFKEVREISDLEGFLALIDEFGHDLVVGKADAVWGRGHDYEVTVYDDHLE